MVSRNVRNVRDILHSESLNCYPAENQAAKIFANWLKEHPEYQISDVDMCIDSFEREEDHYGNGGGYDRYIRIFKSRPETKEEYNTRVKGEEDEKFEEFSRGAHRCVCELIRELSIYPNFVSQEITDKENEIMNAINEVVRKCLKEKLNEG